MISTNAFTSKLYSRGYDFVSGVPCSLLASLINGFTVDDRWRYFSAANEGLAVGMAAGAFISGRKPVVFMQNSGLGNATDGLTSLTSIQQTPLLLLISWRGEQGTNDEPQHDMMGRILNDLLKLLDISFGTLATDGKNFDALLDEAHDSFLQRESFAIIIKEKTLAAQHQSKSRVPSREAGTVETGSRCRPSEYPSRLSVVDAVQKTAPDTAGIVASTGKMSRELLMVNDGARNLYVVGSMGLAPAIGLGISLFNEKEIIVLDGDGSILMQMGALAMMGSYGSHNLTHIVLDNGAHESTGGQETIAKNVRFANVAASCGFVRTFECFALADFSSAFSHALSQQDGPVSIHAHVALGSADKLPRPQLSPADNMQRFRSHLLSA